MPIEQQAAPHTYDYDSFACTCGGSMAYRLAKRGDQPWLCVRCDQPCVRPAAPPAALPAPVRNFLDTWDNAAARALSGDSSVAIPRVLFEAVTEARKELP